MMAINFPPLCRAGRIFTDFAMCNCFSKNLGLGGGLSGVVGATRNAAMSIATASATATFTADEIIVETALGGTQYRLSSFNKTINLGVVGAGGMDVAVSAGVRYLGIYAIYNPTTGASALLATANATDATGVFSTIYNGALPSGYTASALISVWLTSSGTFYVGYQIDRKVYITSNVILSTTTTATAASVLSSSSSAFPKNAKTISGSIATTTSSQQVAEIWLLALPIIYNGPRFALNSIWASGGGLGSCVFFNDHAITTPQTIYYSAFSTNGATFQFSINLTGYTF